MKLERDTFMGRKPLDLHGQDTVTLLCWGTVDQDCAGGRVIFISVTFVQSPGER